MAPNNTQRRSTDSKSSSPSSAVNKVFPSLPTIQPAEHATGRVRYHPKTVTGGGCTAKEEQLPPKGRAPLPLPRDLNNAAQVDVKKVAIICNPNAGKKSAPSLMKKARKMMEAKGVEVEVWMTEYSGHAEAYMKEIQDLDDYDVVVGIGGDGTLNEMLWGLVNREDGGKQKDGHLLPLALIAGGTGNSLMQDNELMKCEDAVNRILEGNIMEVDGGKISFKDGSYRYWFNVIGTGLGVDANLRADKLRWMGLMRYDVGAVYEILRGFGKKVKAVIDDEYEWEGEYSMSLITNTQSAKFRFCPDATLDDGYLDMSLWSMMGKGRMLNLFDALKDDGKHVFAPEVTTLRFKKITLEPLPEQTSPCYINLDGENMGQLPITVEAQPKLFRMII